jgi:RHS repeat-associated protein
VWAETEPAEERDAAGTTVVKRYVAQGVKEGADDYFYTRDHLGSLVNLTDTSLTLRARYAYDPYGRGTRTSGNRDADIGFTGHMIDRDADLALTYFRGYDPSLGRWLSRDPLGLAAGPNVYAYGDGDPVTTVDPLGLHPLVAFLIGGALVGLATQAIGDLAMGNLSSWQAYAAAGAGGAAGGAATNLARQFLEGLTGKRCEFDVSGFAAETAFGGLMGKVGPMVAPFTAGNGSLAHVGRTQVTRFLRGQTSSWSPSTLAKMFIGRSADQGVFPSIIPAAAIGGSGALPSSGSGCGCN